jgi:hypothetical protein
MSGLLEAFMIYTHDSVVYLSYEKINIHVQSFVIIEEPGYCATLYRTMQRRKMCTLQE